MADRGRICSLSENLETTPSGSSLYIIHISCPATGSSIECPGSNLSPGGEEAWRLPLEPSHSVGLPGKPVPAHHSLELWSNLLLSKEGTTTQTPEPFSNRRWAKLVNKPSIMSTERQALVSVVVDIGRVDRWDYQGRTSQDML
jgi:hypothetical protein